MPAACRHNALLLLGVCSDQPTGRLALVFELLDRNVYEMIKGRTTHVEVRWRRRGHELSCRGEQY
jgi:hypothetical protein